MSAVKKFEETVELWEKVAELPGEYAGPILS